MAGSKTEPQLLVARKGFVIPGGRAIKAGQIVRSDDPCVKGRKGLFDDAEVVVERATANPGELRVNKKRS